MDDIVKIAALEDSGVTDSKTGLHIRISTTTRIMFRRANSNNPAYASMRNAQLNEIIAKEFLASADKVLHYFKLKGTSSASPVKRIAPEDVPEPQSLQGMAEIRGWKSSMFFISAVRPSYIDVISIQQSWKQPKMKLKKVL